jgi:hypothetical protein
MESGTLLYMTGEEIHAGDRVQYKGTFATVVFVSDGEIEESTPGYDDYGGSGRGIVVCDDDGVTEAIGEPDELLSFVDRG